MNGYTSWTPREIDRLKIEWRKGVAIKLIAYTLNHSENSVRGQVDKFKRRGELLPRKQGARIIHASTWIEEPTYKRARERARARGLSFSAYVRSLVMRDIT